MYLKIPGSFAKRSTRFQGDSAKKGASGTLVERLIFRRAGWALLANALVQDAPARSVPFFRKEADVLFVASVDILAVEPGNLLA